MIIQSQTSSSENLWETILISIVIFRQFQAAAWVGLTVTEVSTCLEHYEVDMDWSVPCTQVQPHGKAQTVLWDSRSQPSLHVRITKVVFQNTNARTQPKIIKSESQGLAFEMPSADAIVESALGSCFIAKFTCRQDPWFCWVDKLVGEIHFARSMLTCRKRQSRLGTEGQGNVSEGCRCLGRPLWTGWLPETQGSNMSQLDESTNGGWKRRGHLHYLK